MRLLFCLVFLALVLSCRKTDQNHIKSSLVGSWRPESAPDGTALIFLESGKLQYKLWDQPLGFPYTRFRIVNDSTVHFITPALTIKSVRFHVEGTQLNLEGACIMDCSERFYKILPL